MSRHSEMGRDAAYVAVYFSLFAGCVFSLAGTSALYIS